MSEFTDISNSDVVECPYCGNKYQPEAEDYSEDDRPEECYKCKKKYFVNQSFSVNHQMRPDCELNNIKHNFVDFENGEFQFCSVCDTCRKAE